MSPAIRNRARFVSLLVATSATVALVAAPAPALIPDPGPHVLVRTELVEPTTTGPVFPFDSGPARLDHDPGSDWLPAGRAR